ncbi:TonB-dependent receptor [Parasphingopyxis marina]|uniref:TonB-dependent receptor n=1 Tax=Parasphingopyxis marina TaxID=2761622 RepID=A0A842HZL1_9SPHN|nr:TonB-dependent receptor [Parasphingopyxis marina]MBC2778636.1 TonB-dependent receptor [Parasphingopyxis marina]
MKKNTLVAISTFALCAGLATPAWSQTEGAATENSGSSVIVVTAQFREQNLQDTPLAITAVNAEMLEARGQTNISSVAAQAPNVTLAAQNQEYGSGLIAYIRGIGQNDPNFALEPGVGIYIDDVYLPTLTGSLLDLLDVERVEILRGPQGTLAGRNSIGGAIKIFSQRPRGDNSGWLEATYGSYDRLDFRGMMDIGLTDNLAVRVSGVSRNQDGYITRLDYALTHPGSNVPTQAPGSDPVLGTLGGHSIAAGRIAFNWTPSPSVEVNLAADYTRERSEAGVATLLYANAAGELNNDPTRPWLRGTDGNTVPYNCQFVPYGQNSCDTLTGYDRRYVTYSTFNDLYPGDSQFPYHPLTLDPHSDLDNYGIALTVDIDLADNLALKSITSWREYESDWSYDVDGAPLAANILNQNQTNEQISQEIRLSGTLANDLIDFTIGGFYFDTDGFYTARVDLPYAELDFIHGPDPTPSRNEALFANVTVNVTDDFHLTGGLRQSWDRKEYAYRRRNPDLTPVQGPCNFFLGAPTAGPTDIGNQPNCLLFGVNGTTAVFTNSRLDWRVAADYRFSPEFLIYGQVSTGYRAGGFNARPFFPSQATPHVPESITSYELGFKSDLFDRMMRLNVSAFYFDYSDIVLLSTFCADLPAGQQAPCLRPTNVGSAEVKGLEIETFINPIDNLTIDGSLSYLDFQYTSIDPTASTGVAIDDITPYTPEWQWSFGIQYDVQDVFSGELSFRVDGTYQSHIYTEAGNVDQLLVPNDVAAVAPFSQPGGGGPIPVLSADNRIEGYFLANGRISWESGNGDWGLALEVQNIFDRYYLTTKVNDAFAVGHVYGSPGRPRTWALTVRRSF